MKQRSGNLVLLICLLEITFCSGQFSLVKAFVDEFWGRAVTYRVPDANSSTVADCPHDPVKIHWNFHQMSRLTTCILEIAKYGAIRPLPDQNKRADQTIRNHGYYLVAYSVTSKDGYIQTLFRITGSPSSPPRKGKPAVLLFHGASGSADSWLLLGHKSLAFKLVNAGYEAWLVNSRGTDYSMGHVKYDAEFDLEYWDFSYHEMAVEDVPLYIDLMLTETGTQKIFFLGYSMGANIYFVTMSEFPELNNKIHAAMLYGPMISTSHTTSPVRLVSLWADLSPRFQELMNIALRGRISVGFPLMNRLATYWCSSTAVRCGLCATMHLNVAGDDFPQVTPDFLPSAFRSLNTLSVKQVIHNSQNYRACALKKFDYGPKKNIEMYGQSDPPTYNFSNVRGPVYIYYGVKDDYAALDDLKRLKDSLPPGVVKAIRPISWNRFNHFDFVLARDADILVYDQMINDMKKYAP